MNVSAVIATAVNVEGRREIIGFDIVTTEDTAAWTAFLRSFVARGLSGVELVICDAHGGIKTAIAAVFAGGVVATVPNPLRRHRGYADVWSRVLVLQGFRVAQVGIIRLV